MIAVRKWGLILLAFVNAIAMAAAFTVIFGPAEGSTEFHRREYVAAVNELYGFTYVDRFRGLCSRVLGRQMEPMSEERKAHLRKEKRRHEKALLEAGFLVQHEIRINNRLKVARVAMQLNQQPKNKDPYTKGVLTRLQGTNGFAVIVITTTNDVGKWEEFVRQADEAADGD